MKKMLIMAVACLMAAVTFVVQCAATPKNGKVGNDVEAAHYRGELAATL